MIRITYWRLHVSFSTRALLAFAAAGALSACAGGTRGVELTPNQIAELPSIGTGDCRALVSNMTGRPIRAFYQQGLEESKIRNMLDVWPEIGFMETSASVVLRAPCAERQVVIGWRQDVGRPLPDVNEVLVRQTLRPGQTIAIRLHRPSEASCNTDNAVNSIAARCIFGGD